jgi:hypothetical protein
MDWEKVLLGALIAGVYFWVKDKLLKDKINKIEDRLKKIENFTPSQQYTSADGSKVIAYDEGLRQFAICSLNNDETSYKVFSYADLLSVEIFYDGNTVTKTNRVSQIGGALIGGVALGGLGAVVGGLSGKTSSKKEVEKIELRLIVNNKESPIQDILFLNMKCKEWTPLYKESEKDVRHWFGIVSLLIKEADKQDEKNTSNITQDLAEEVPEDKLEKLHGLLQKNIISEEEFNTAKQKLLANI